MKPLKIDLLTPWQWKDNYDWFRRDLGLVCDALRERGHEASLILYKAAGMPANDNRLVGVDESELSTPDWWLSRKPDLVISIAGCRPSAYPIHVAIKKAGISLWNKMDSDGVLGLWGNPCLALYTMWLSSKMKGSPLPILRALGIFAYRALNPAAGDRGGVKTLEISDKFLIESPLAVSRMQRFFRSQGKGQLSENVVLFPGPSPDDRIFNSSSTKKNQVIAVGRWNDFIQKDTPKLFRVLHGFLRSNPDFEASVIGNYDDRAAALHANLPNEIRDRIVIHGRLPNTTLTSHYQKSKISLCVSRGESVHIVSTEAVCCGCSIVGPAQIAAMGYYTGAESGTLAFGRSDGAFLDALNTEVSEWQRGARDPVEISRHFREELSASSVAKIVERMLQE